MAIFLFVIDYYSSMIFIKILCYFVNDMCLFKKNTIFIRPVSKRM